MPRTDQVQQHLGKGELALALSELKGLIRKAPGDQELRFLLFELLCVTGDWTAAASQLSTYQTLTQGAEQPFAAMLHTLLKAEQTRERVFAAQEAPTVLGQPPEWMASLIQFLQLLAAGSAEEAMAARASAMESAPGIGGALNELPFEWLMDGDSRLGPVMEIILNGQYFWVAQERLRGMTIHPPEQLRDLVWAVAEITLETGATLPAHLPARYPAASTWAEDALRMGRATSWHSPAEGCFVGSGQRLFLGSAGEHPVLEVRTLTFAPQP